MKTAIQLISNANSSKNKIKVLRNKKDKSEEKLDGIIYQIRSEEREEIQKIDKIYTSKRQKVEDQKEKEDKVHDEKVDELYHSITNLEKTIYFLRAAKKENRFDAGKITNYEHYGLSKQVSRLSSYSDDYMKLSYVMFDVNRPKNKVALWILGDSKLGSYGYNEFGTKILELDYSYGCGLREQGGANLIHEVKYFPERETAKKYAIDNPIEKVLKNFLKKYELVKQECIKTNKNYDIADFEKYRMEKAKKYFESHTPHLKYFEEHYGIKETKWSKLTITEKRKVMELAS